VQYYNVTTVVALLQNCSWKYYCFNNIWIKQSQQSGTGFRNL